VYGTAMADAFSGHSMPSGNGGTIGLAISLPLFDAGQRRAEVAQASASQDRLDADLQNTDLAVTNEVRQSWLDVETTAENFTNAQAALLAAQSAYEVTNMRVQAQKSILVELLDAQTALTRARANLAQALYDHATAVARLQHAEGRFD
jgi:outer membrane protein TolC